MPARSKKKKAAKRKPLKKKKIVKKVKKAKRSKAKAAKKVVKKTVKKAKAAKKAAKSKEKVIGKVTHYYDRIGVAIVELQDKIRRGDLVCLKRGEKEIIQPVSSLQIDHAAVEGAKKGDVIGMKVDAPVHEGTIVVPA
jgi:putative protease